MKIVVISTCGTVGKTTLVAQLFAPLMPRARIIAVESINETALALGVEVTQVTGDHFGSIYQQSALLDDELLDVGASQAERFLLGLARYAGSHREYDLYAIPVTPGTKEMSETIRLVRTLAAYGIETGRICLVFNRVREGVEIEFGPLLAFGSKEGLCMCDPQIAVPESEIYGKLAAKRIGIADVLADTTDYRSLARAIPADGDKKAQAHYLDMMGLRSLAETAQQDHDRAFAALLRTMEANHA